MIKGYRKAKSDILWVLDSNVSVAPTAIGVAVDLFENPKIGLIHHIPVSVHISQLGGYLDALYMTAFHARVYSAVNSMKIASMIIGKSNLYRKSSLEKVGGLQVFAKFMSEDNEIGKAIWDQGLSHIIAPELAFQSMGVVPFREFISRRVRWVRIRKASATIATYYEPFSQCIPSSLLTSYYLCRFLPFSFTSLFTFNVTCWFLADMLMLYISSSRVYNENKRHEVMTMALLWPVGELLAPLIWFLAITGSEINWRGTAYVCNADGTGTPIHKKQV